MTYVHITVLCNTLDFERLLSICLPARVLVSIHLITVVAEEGSKIWRLNMSVSRNLLKKAMLVNGFKGLKFVVEQTNGMMQRRHGNFRRYWKGNP